MLNITVFFIGDSKFVINLNYDALKILKPKTDHFREHIGTAIFELKDQYNAQINWEMIFLDIENISEIKLFLARLKIVLKT